MQNVVELSGVNKAYGSSRALVNVTTTFASGRFYVLVGPNGAGKSTLMRVMARIEAFDSGSGIFMGKDILIDSPESRRKTAYVSESIDYAVPISMGQLSQGLSKFYPDWSAALFQEVSEALHLDLAKTFGSLSRGQRIQFALAVAVATKPDVLLLDEVTSVLDARARIYFMHLLGRLVDQGATVIMATNMVSEVQFVADNLVLIFEGVVKLNEPVETAVPRFLKLRRMADEQHAVFADPVCVEIGPAIDGSISSTLIAQSPH